tara:strand:+ start:167 stop:397 length:231 start_codon:yes stop_codon:yes gene_type:complete
MKRPDIKKDVDFVLKSLNNTNNKIIHFPALLKLIKNFEDKWDDLMGPGVTDFYINFLNNKYKDALQYSKRNDRPKR